jgi:hypothetical protein
VYRQVRVGDAWKQMNTPTNEPRWLVVRVEFETLESELIELGIVNPPEGLPSGEYDVDFSDRGSRSNAMIYPDTPTH